MVYLALWAPGLDSRAPFSHLCVGPGVVCCVGVRPAITEAWGWLSELEAPTAKRRPVKGP